jgi:hypothetical protein
MSGREEVVVSSGRARSIEIVNSTPLIAISPLDKLSQTVVTHKC